MNKIYHYRYFIIIKKKNFLFQVLDITNKTIFLKEVSINNDSIVNIYDSIENFLENNIFTIEKNLKDFIKEIYIIFESDLFFEVGSSIKHNFQKMQFKIDDIKDTLLEINNQFRKHSPEDEIIHMVIKKYTVGDIEYEFLPNQIEDKNLIIQANFICLKDEIVSDLKKIFLKYQISVNKILSCNYLKGLNDHNGENILKLAENSINGLHTNEVLLVDRPLKKPGFFEKFFNFLVNFVFYSNICCFFITDN